MQNHDIVLYGATGFTGRLVAHYLAGHPERDSFSWAIAGRDPERLESVRASLAAEHGVKPDAWVADTSDPVSVSAMVSRTRVVLTTAGPYSQYNGRTVVEACVRAGCDYADLSGEFWFQRRMIDDFHEEAKRTGARIVLAAGFDSIPSDLGTQLAVERIEDRGERAARVKALFTDYAGSFSGGTRKTLGAMVAVMRSGGVDPDLCRDPYVLAPGAASAAHGESVTGWDRVRFDRDFNTIGVPFLMAPVNARIVRRSLALTGRLPCRYEEGAAATAWLKAGWLWTSRGFGYLVGDPIPLRPRPGQGPPAWLRRAGRFRVLIKALPEKGRNGVMVEVRGRGDPGYGATSRMLAETGLSLLHDRRKEPGQGGVLTPATALGVLLRKRLASVEGGRFMQFRVVGESRAS